MKVSKVFITAFLVSLFMIFFSCNNNVPIDLSSGSDETLRQAALRREQSLMWAREIESVRLTRDITTSPVISKNVKFSPEVFAVSSDDYQPVYPGLEGFGSLDTSEITQELSVFLEKVAASIASWPLDSKYMEKDSLFSLILFKSDVEKSWKNEFGNSFPEGDRVFDSLIFGEPFVESEAVLVPVRFFHKKNYLDLELYIYTGDKFSIGQILINRWGK